MLMYAEWFFIRTSRKYWCIHRPADAKKKDPRLQLAMDMVRIKKLSSMLPEATVIFSFPHSLQTAAGMSSTATEIAEWIIGLQSLQILKLRSSLDALWSPAILNNGSTGGFNRLLNGYAAGWPVIKRTHHPVVAVGGRKISTIYLSGRWSHHHCTY